MKNLLIFGSVGLVVLLVVFWAIGISNTEKRMFLSGKAAQQNCEVIFDNTWKTIQLEAQVTEQYKDGFREIYVDMMEARYSDDGQGNQTLMKWIQESNPNFDSSLYGKLMNIIEGSRASFTLEQQKLIDIDRQHKEYRITFPNSLVVGGRPDLDIKLVTSSKTKESFRTGEENEIDIFKN